MSQDDRLTPQQVHAVAFSKPRLFKRGYDEDEVKPPIGKRGYNEEEVDAFVERIRIELARR